MRICEQSVAIQSGSSLGRVCYVAIELDSPVRRRKRKNFSDRFVRGAEGQDGLHTSWFTFDPGSDCFRSQWLFYFHVLDQADEACRAGIVDVTAMEDLLGGMLARQLAGFYRSAGGKLPPGVELDSL